MGLGEAKKWAFYSLLATNPRLRVVVAGRNGGQLPVM